MDVKFFFNIEYQQKIKEWVKENTKNLSEVRDKIYKKSGMIATKNNIKKYKKVGNNMKKDEEKIEYKS